MRKWLAAVLGLAVLVPVPPSAHALDASCGMTVPPGETAVLSADLNCPSSDTGLAIVLGAKATLDLNGFTLTVGEDMIGVFCAHTACSVVSSAAAPGVIEGDGEGAYGLISNLQPDDRPIIKKLVIDNVVVRNFEYAGMYAAFGGASRLSRLTVAGNGGPGIIGKKMFLTDVTASGNGFAFGLSGQGIVGTKIRGARVTVDDNTEQGLASSGSVNVRALTATGNGVAGVAAQQVKLTESTLTGNPIDIQSERRPRVQDTTCDHSNWGVCSLD